MIQQIRFLKGECRWVNFPDGAIKPGVVYGYEVINVSSCQTEGFRDGTRTSPGEKDHSCAFVIMQQQVGKQGSAISAHGDANTLLENTIAKLNVHIVEEKVEHFCNFLGFERNMLHLLVLVQWAWGFLSILLLYFLSRPLKFSLTWECALLIQYVVSLYKGYESSV